MIELRMPGGVTVSGEGEAVFDLVEDAVEQAFVLMYKIQAVEELGRQRGYARGSLCSVTRLGEGTVKITYVAPEHIGTVKHGPTKARR